MEGSDLEARSSHFALFVLAALLGSSLAGCEQVAKLDELHVEHPPEDAGMVIVIEPDAGPDENAELREQCVRQINEQRTALGLAPLARASAQQERCADEGAATDNAMNTPHYAAQQRSAHCAHIGLGPENSCPNWPLNEQGLDNSQALAACIQRMWDQGMPPVSSEACAKDLAPGGCFEKYGEWINLTSARAKFVACGFAEGNGTLWVNLDFTAR